MRDEIICYVTHYSKSKNTDAKSFKKHYRISSHNQPKFKTLFSISPFLSVYVLLRVLVYLQFISLHSIFMLCVSLALFFWTWPFADRVVKKAFFACVPTLNTVTSSSEGE